MTKLTGLYHLSGPRAGEMIKARDQGTAALLRTLKHLIETEPKPLTEAAAKREGAMLDRLAAIAAYISGGY